MLKSKKSIQILKQLPERELPTDIFVLEFFRYWRIPKNDPVWRVAFLYSAYDVIQRQDSE